MDQPALGLPPDGAVFGTKVSVVDRPVQIWFRTLRANSKAFKAILTCHVSWDQFLPLIWLKFDPQKGKESKTLLLVVTNIF